MEGGRFAEAEALLREARVEAVGHPLGMHLLAIVCAQGKRFDESDALWESLLRKNLLTPLVHINYGRSLQLQERYSQALELLEQAVKIAPKNFTAQLNYAVCLRQTRQIDRALHHVRLAVALEPQNPLGHFNLGRILQDRYEFENAHQAYLRALELDPSHRDAATCLLFSMHYRPDPDMMRVRELAQRYGERLCAQVLPLPPAAPTRAGQRLRVALLSGDFREHPVGWFLLNVLPHVDRRRIELVGFCNSGFEDPVTQALRAQCPGGWHRVDPLDAAQAAQLVRRSGVDILVDLSGITKGHRNDLLALRPARLQVSWLGYFGTTGLPTVDYLLADPHCVPPSEEGFYTERIWRLPHTRFCMAEPADAPPVSALPALRSAAGTVTLGCFQEIAKINARVLAAWAAILAAAPQARLRLQAHKLAHADERARLQALMRDHAIDLDRVQFHPGVDRRAYLEAHGEVDFIVDTFPYTGGTTTAEALWMGVPTLTLALPGMLSRQGQAHLVNVGLPEWVARDDADYVARAVLRARPQGLADLASLRGQLRERCRRSPLFDGPGFAAAWTQALLDMQARHDQSVAG